MSEGELQRLRSRVAELERRLAEAACDAESAVEDCCQLCRGRVARRLGVQTTLSRVSEEALEMLAIFDCDTTPIAAEVSSIASLVSASDKAETSSAVELADPLLRFSQSQRAWSEQRGSARGSSAPAGVQWSLVVVALLAEWLPLRARQALACCSRELNGHARGLREERKRMELVAALRRDEGSYLAAMRAAGRLAAPLAELTGGGSAVLFEALPTLQLLSSKLLAEVRERLTAWQRGTTMGDAFLALGPALKLYGQFVGQYAAVNAAYSSFLRSERVRALLHQAEKSSGCMPLGVLLAHMNGRVAHYVEVVKALIRATDERSPDASLLIAALKLISSIAFSMLDEEPRSQQALLFLRHVRGMPPAVLNRVVNFQWAGTFYWTRRKLGGRPKEKEVKLMLFQDFVLLVLSDGGGGWQFFCSLAIGACAAVRDGFALTLSSLAPQSTLSVALTGATAESVDFVAARVAALSAQRRDQLELDAGLEAAAPELLRAIRSRNGSLSALSPKMPLRKDPSPKAERKDSGAQSSGASSGSRSARSPSTERRKETLGGSGSPALSSPSSPRAAGALGKLSPRFNKARPASLAKPIPPLPVTADITLLIELPPDYSAIALTVPSASTLAFVLLKACDLRNLAPADYRLYDTQRGAFIPNLAALVSPDLHLKLRSGPPAVPAPALPSAAAGSSTEGTESYVI